MNCKRALSMLTQVGLIWKYVDDTSAERLIHTFITSKLYYPNGLLYVHLDTLISKLQRVQNAAARVVSRTRIYDSITPAMNILHWL